MGGGSSGTEKQQTALEQQQVALGQQQAQIGQEFIDLSKNRIAYSDILQQPAIQFYSQIASGNPQSVISAAAPQIGQIANNAQQAKANIMNNTPAGAGRDFALAQLEQGKSSQVSSTLNSLVTQAPQVLAQIGAGQASEGLQMTGAGFTGLGQGASSFASGQSSLSSIAQEQNARKASTMSFFGSLVGAAGNAAGGGAFGSLGGAAA